MIRRLLRKNLSNLLIAAGIIVIAIPFVTEVYGYFTAKQLAQAWDKQASSQKKQADRIRVQQSRLISTGQLPEEDSVFNPMALKKRQALLKKSAKPFPKTKVIIPKIKVNQVVMSGTSPDVLQFGPGHYTGMANPGDKGNVGIAGHRVTYTHPFNRLDELSKGDLIILETVDYIYEYEVESMEVTDPKDIHNLLPSSDPRITLTTCNPKYSAKTRLNVMGVLINSKPRRTNIVRMVKNILEEPKKPRKISSKARSYQELVRDYQKEAKAVGNNPVDAYIYAGFSRTCLELGRYDESLWALRRAELIEPDSVEIQKLRADFEARKTQLEATVAKAEQATQGSNMAGDPEPYFELGNMYMATGQYQEAIAVLTRPTQMLPYMADVYVYLAAAYERAGADALAVRAYTQALKYDPSFKDALQGIERVKNKKPAREVAESSVHYRFRPQ